MIALAKHIEYLLLSRNCVIIPSLGAFHTMHTPARRIASENVFLPPIRNVHFDANITVDEEGVFLKSLCELYDMTLEEAVIRCEELVAEFHKTLITEGSIDFGTIGIFTLEDDAIITMASCECGVVTPSYYGLDALHFRSLTALEEDEKRKQQIENERISIQLAQNQEFIQAEKFDSSTSDAQVISVEEEVPEQKQKAHITAHSADKSVVITLSRTTINYVMAIAASLLLFYIIKPTSVGDYSILRAEETSTAGMFLQPNMVPEFEEAIVKDTTDIKESTDTASINAILVDVTNELANEGMSYDNEESSSLNSVEDNTLSAKEKAQYETKLKEAEEARLEAERAAKQAAEAEAKAKAAEQMVAQKASTASNGSFCIILSSGSSKDGAERFVNQLARRGINTTIKQSGRLYRVVIAGFASQNAAQEQMTRLKARNNDLNDAWVLKL